MDTHSLLRLTSAYDEALRQAETVDWLGILRGMGIGVLVILGLLLWMAYQDWRKPPGGMA